MHYHITKLYEGGLLDLVEEKKIGGVTEKNYQSRSKWFNSASPEALDSVISASFPSKKSTTINLRLTLTTNSKNVNESSLITQSNSLSV
ncbi:hypothetical protein SAMN04488601_10414 [Paenibacillus sp. 453mf]|nr:hypothetical protein [Paenibacillus sp. 453mf]SFS81094.1 hypothetical protein SAMN04488601_10414 [Paenibacillus sp. 453mf]